MKHSAHRRQWRTLPVMFAAAALALSNAACRQRASSDLEEPGAGTVALEERCESLLASAVDGAQPDRMGISSEAATVASTLNEWRQRCAARSEDDAAAAAPLLERLLPAQTLERTLARDFSVRDAMHLRNAIWFRRVTENIGRQTDGELQRVVQLFDYVCRTVVLTDDPIAALPKTVFGAALYGRGTAEDRAWLFAGLLGAMRVDAVILRAADGQPDGSDGRWCVGVLLGEDCYLFDTRLGLPVPSDMDAPQQIEILTPLTLRQAASEPQHLEALSRALGTPYPLSATDFQDIRAEIVGDSSLWAPRMAALQSALTGDQAVLIYSPLQDTALGPGTWSRIALEHKQLWKEEHCRVWPYPERRWVQQQSPDDRQQQQLSAYLSAFNAPTPIVHVREFQTVQTKDGKTYTGEVAQVDERGIALKLEDENQVAVIPREAAVAARLEKLEFQYGPPQRQLLRTRIQHLLMDHQAAMTGYTVTRLWEKFPPLDKKLGIAPDELARFPQFVDPQVRQMHRRAAIHAFFWTGVSQFEAGDYAAAAETLQRYLAAHPGDDWESAARTLRARALIAARRPRDAIAVLQASRPREREHPVHRVLLARCQAVVPRQ